MNWLTFVIGYVAGALSVASKLRRSRRIAIKRHKRRRFSGKNPKPRATDEELQALRKMAGLE